MSTTKEKLSMRRWPMVRLLGEVKKSWILFLISQLATITYLVLEMVMRTMMGRTMDAAAAGGTDFWRNLALLIAAPLMAAPFHTLTMLTKFRVSQRVETSLRIQVGEKSTRLSIPALEEQRSGDIMAHLGSELHAINGFTGYGMAQIVSFVTDIIGTTLFMAVIDWKLTLYFMIAVIVVLPVNFYISRPIRKLEEQLRIENGRAQQAANEGLQALLTVKSFRLEILMDQRFYRALAKAMAADLRMQRITAGMNSSGAVLGYVPMMVMLALGAMEVTKGHLTAGMLLSLTTVSNGFVRRLTSIPEFFGYIQHARGACARIYQFLDLPQEQGGVEEEPILDAPYVSFERVSFAYQDCPLLLKEITFTLKKGEKVALVGASGSGKSTILKLVCGFLCPVSGKVKVRGHEVKQWALQPLRDQLAYVTQESYLFPGSIKDNLLAAKNTASEAELEEVCHRAGIWEFIKKRGWDAQVGEAGIRLSGGEQQRLSIARAMLKDAPVLLLDEPTSALDAAAERVVQESLDRLMEGRTALIVAHRMATVRNADRILVLSQGRIIDSGTHEALMETCSVYRDMVEKQV